MPRIANWRGKQVFDEIAEEALKNAEALMDSVVMSAKDRCPASPIYHPPGWSSANVDFTAYKGTKREKSVKFSTEKRWIGRSPGDLRNTIRRVNLS